MNINLIKLQLRNNIVAIVVCISIYVIQFGMIEKSQIVFMGGLALLFSIISYYPKLIGKDESIFALVPLENKVIFKNFIYGILSLISIFVLVGYISNICIFGSGPYNLFISIRNFVILLNIGLGLVSFSTIIELISKLVTRRIGLDRSKNIDSILFFIILIGIRIPFVERIILSPVYFFYKHFKTFNYNHIISSTTRGFIDMASYRPEKVGELVDKMFLIENRAIFINLDKLLLNVLIWILVILINYGIYLKIKEG